MLFVMLLGVILYLIGAIGLLVAEFQVGILWGICGLIFQISHLLFIIFHFQESKKWLGYLVAGVLLIALGVIFDGSVGPSPLGG